MSPNPPVVAAPPAKPKVESLELRISVIHKADDEHVQHVVVHITNDRIAVALLELIENSGDVDIAGADDGSLIEIE